jgi:hypothetical protein
LSREIYIITMREGKEYSLSELARGCNCESELVKKAINELENMLRIYSYRLDCIPPRIAKIEEEYRVFSGFWTGIAEIKIDDNFVRVIIKPRLRKYSVMIDTINSVLGDKVLELLPRGYSILYSHPSMMITSIIHRLLTYLYNLVNNEPRRLCYEVSSSDGYIADIHIGSDGLIPVVKRLICKPNKGLALLLLISMRIISDLLNTLEKQLGEIQNNNIEYLLILHRKLMSKLKRRIYTFYSGVSEFIYRNVSLPFNENELLRYSEALSIIRTLSKQRELINRGSKEYSFLLMTPSTKIYELYIFSLIIKQFKKSYNCRYEIKHGKAYINCNDKKYILYFNKIPKRYSRIIHSLSKRTPRPDIFLKMDHKTIIIEAKYRKLSGKLLRLSDALRIAGYLADAARNGLREALIVALDKPSNSVIETSLDGLKAKISFLRVNPDKCIENIAEQIIYYSKL